MTPQEAKQRLERIWKSYGEAYEIYDEDVTAFDMAINALGAIEQIQWERDMAIKQLHDLGYGLGEKPRDDNSSSDKLIKASDAVDVVAKHSALYGDGEVGTDDGEALLYDIMSEIMNLPSAQPERCEDCENFRKTRLLIPQPEIIHCENCKNWQTGWRNREWGQGYHWCSYIDGVCRSDWFCADAERRTDETD